ncbi:MAG: MFS transporter [Ktedonobacteraceae bacterium]|nr:MFS transporter [Ktedonobacteraceae bacterium]
MSLLVEYIGKFGHFQRNARLYLLSNALSGISAGIVLILYNLYLSSLGYRADFIGLVLFVGAVGGGVAIFPAGVCVDRFGGKSVLLCSNLAFAAAAAGQILFPQPLPLLIISFLAGGTVAFFLVVNAPYLTANSTPEDRPHLFSLNIVLGLGTVVLGEPLGGALPTWFRTIPWLMSPLPSWLLAAQPEPRSYQLAVLFAGILAAPSLIPIFLLSDDRPARKRKSMPTLHAWGAINRVSTQKSDTYSTLRAWRQQFHLRKVLAHPIIVVLLVQVLLGFGMGLFTPYFNLYFVKQLKASPTFFGLIDGAANGINALFTLFAPLLAVRIGKITTITITRLLAIPLLLTIGLTNLLPLAATFYLFRQGLMDMSLGIFQVFSMEIVSQQQHGLVNSTYQAFSQVAFALSVPLGGLIIAHKGYTPAFILGAILYLLATGALWGRFKNNEH